MDRVLPTRVTCKLTIKTGIPLGSSRDKDVTVQFEIDVAEGYGVFKAKVQSAFDTDASFEWKASHHIHLKPTKIAPKKAFAPVEESNFSTAISASWHTARLRKGRRDAFLVELFVYAEKPKYDPSSGHGKCVYTVLPLVEETLAVGGMAFGPATLRDAATAQVRLPDSDEVQIPDNATFRQLQHFDLLQQEAVAQPGRQDDGFADVGVQINMSVVCPWAPIHELSSSESSKSDLGRNEMRGKSSLLKVLDPVKLFTESRLQFLDVEAGMQTNILFDKRDDGLRAAA